MEISKDGIWRLLLVLFLGQLASLFVAIATFTASYIAHIGVDTPLAQSFFIYLSLAVFYGSIFLYRRQKLMVPWYWYVILAFVDLQGNYLVVKAYQYSSITSVALLNCWIIPWVMILTWYILQTRYTLFQYAGASICVLGLAFVLFSDAGVSGGGGRNHLLGDTLVVAGTLCFALSNVGQEFCVKTKDLVEVMAMLGVFGMLVCVCEISIFERKDIASVEWSPTLIALFAGYTAAMFLFYTAVPLFLRMSGATLFNLSLLTADMWAVLIKIFFYRQKVDWLYCLAFAAVAVGLIIYTLNDATSSIPTQIEDEEATTQYEPLPEENSKN